MDVKNYNRNRKKPVRKKGLRIVAFLLLFIGVVLAVFRYYKFMSKSIYEESVSHLTEVLHQSDQMLRELTNKNLTYLHIWGENLQNISGEDEIRDYIKKAQEDAGFLEFFFLSSDGDYKMATGETGYLGLQENIEEDIRQGNDVIANAAVPGKSQLLVFATPKAHGIYQGFEYDAIAIAYENSDIVDVLDISAFDGNAQSFIIHPDGRVVIDHSSELWGNVYNFFGFLSRHSDMSEKEINVLLEKFKAGRTDAMLLNLDGRNYYLVYEKSDIQDWMFLGLVQADIVNASMNNLQFTTMLLVGAVVLCIAAFFISLIIQKNRKNLRRKDVEIRYRDELFQKLSMNVDDVFLMLDAKTYQADYVGAPITVAPGSVGTNTVKMFAGAKEIKLLDNYTKQFNIPKFDLAVDFGWYYFLTKPFFYILDFLYNFIGNMGWAILLFAALLRFLMFPIANKSYESMSKMKKVQPRIKELQERYGDDKMKLQQETLELYRREKINPAAGCLPMLIQIPVFFSLYKVLNISIEIRHAPFIGWIKDLSAPDPLTLSAWTHLPIPGLLDIGVWPILMGLTMWIQQKLNPAPTNKDQARMFAMMPVIFTFMLGHFASGLVIYWTLSNILSIIQQKAIMKKNGVK